MCIHLDGQDEKHNLEFDFQADKPIDNNRNKTVRKFLKTDYEWYLTIDSDNPPMGNPLERIALNKDIIAFPTPIWYSQILEKGKGENPIVWNCFDRADEGGGWREHRPQQGMQRIGAAGTGCMLIHRRVLEKVRPAFFREWDKDGCVVTGSDLLFCKRAGDAGFEVWADYSCACSHYKTIDLAQVYNVMKVRDVTQANRTNINTAEYWDGQWEKRSDVNLPVYSRVVDRIKESMNGQTPYRILDFGCGRGELMEQLGAIEGAEVEGMDISDNAIDKVRDRGMDATVGNEPDGHWDAIVCTEVLEHVDQDRELLAKFFSCADRVIYTVPNNCWPPGLEREHQRCYTPAYCKRITPYVQEVSIIHDYILVVADKTKGDADGGPKQIIDVC